LEHTACNQNGPHATTKISQDNGGNNIHRRETSNCDPEKGISTEKEGGGRAGWQKRKRKRTINIWGSKENTSARGGKTGSKGLQQKGS